MVGTYVNLVGFNAEIFDRFESFNRFVPSAKQFDQASPAVLSIRRSHFGRSVRSDAFEMRWNHGV